MIQKLLFISFAIAFASAALFAIQTPSSLEHDSQLARQGGGGGQGGSGESGCTNGSIRYL